MLAMINERPASMLVLPVRKNIKHNYSNKSDLMNIFQIQIQGLLIPIAGACLSRLTSTTFYLWPYWAMWGQGIWSGHPTILPLVDLLVLFPQPRCPLCPSNSPPVVAEMRDVASLYPF